MMPLVCPGCGGRLEVEEERALVPFTCPYCAAGLTPEKNGKAVFLRFSPAAAPTVNTDQAGPLLDKARMEEDPGKRYDLLLKAEKAAPDDLRVHKALLLHGRLHERDKRRVDFSVIKCYLLHVFEEPQSHSAAQREQILAELFHEERLERALALAPDPDGFTLDYLTDLSQAYVQLFLRGSSKYMKPIFGLAVGGRPSRLLAEPAAGMIGRMLREPLLNDEQRRIMARAFYEGFGRELQGETGPLDLALGLDRDRLRN